MLKNIKKVVVMIIMVVGLGLNSPLVVDAQYISFEEAAQGFLNDYPMFTGPYDDLPGQVYTWAASNGYEVDLSEVPNMGPNMYYENGVLKDMTGEVFYFDRTWGQIFYAPEGMDYFAADMLPNDHPDHPDNFVIPGTEDDYYEGEVYVEEPEVQEVTEVTTVAEPEVEETQEVEESEEEEETTEDTTSEVLKKDLPKEAGKEEKRTVGTNEDKILAMTVLTGGVGLFVGVLLSRIFRRR